MSQVLYISYDGMLEPLGQSQVLGYLEPLAEFHRVRLISFEKRIDRQDRERMAAMRTRLKKRGIQWTPLTYHKTPSTPATAFDIVVGTLVALWFSLIGRVQIVHARSYVPALMALVVKRLTGAKFLFDMRGFWADERTDGGLWPENGRNYHITKKLERQFLLAADHVVTLTHASRDVLEGFDYLKGRGPPISIIPTCADLERFSPGDVAIKKPFTFGYVGSVGTWYLFDETLSFFKALSKLRPDAQLLVVNRNEHATIRAAVARAGIAESRLELCVTEHHNVPGLVRQMHAAGAIIRPCFSKTASAPTKLAEYLGCGVPCVGNIGVGDMKEILETGRVGVILTNFSAADHAAAAQRLIDLLEDPDLQPRCTRLARERFSLSGGVAAYQAIYAELVL